MRLAIDPLEDHSPLILDPDRVEAVEVAFELLQSVRWRYRQIIEPVCRVDCFQFALSGSRHARKLAHPLILEQRLGALVAK